MGRWAQLALLAVLLGGFAFLALTTPHWWAHAGFWRDCAFNAVCGLAIWRAVAQHRNGSGTA